MFKTKSGILSISMAVFILICPQISLADNYTTEEFLKSSVEGQNNYIEISVAMAAIIAAQSAPDAAQCIDNWYFVDIAARAEHNATIRSAMEQAQGFHPSAVILAVLNEQCEILGQ